MKYNTQQPIEIEKAKSKLDFLISKGSIIELTEKRQKRTIKQNSYLHVLFSLYAVEFGYTLEESKITLKRECNFMTYKKNNFIFLKKTSHLNTKELTDFIEWIRNYSSNNGLYLPTSDEYLQNYTEIDAGIEACKQYL